MVTDDGRAKGMKIVLEERGVETKGMNDDKMREVLNTFQDFKNKKTLKRRWNQGDTCAYFSLNFIVSLMLLNGYGVMQKNTRVLMPMELLQN